MRTLIKGGWVVGYDGRQHQVLRDAVCVVEDDRVLHVGKRFDALRLLHDLVGSERRLLGTDYPYDMGESDSLG